MKPTLVILAAGIGSRYGGLKQLDGVGPGGEAIIDYSIFDAIRAGFGKVVFVIREEFEDQIVSHFDARLRGRIRTEYVRQEIHMVPDGIAVPSDRSKPWGTAHAVLVSGGVVKEPFAVINADDFYGPQSYRMVAEFLSSEAGDGDVYCVVGYELSKTLSDFGSVSRGVCEVDSKGDLKSVVERTEIERDNHGIHYRTGDGQQIALTGQESVSMNMWGFYPSVFEFFEEAFARFAKEHSHDIRAELYIPSVVNELIQNGLIRVAMLDSTEVWFGMTYKDDKTAAANRLRRLVDEGMYPENLWA
ncbi:MAG: nucleotidyltransferase [Candidatus Zixiibacteriota bacterium]|nr:MAG: nucleotidyltransferase [candidate division Zixibacteria bacterium]